MQKYLLITIFLGGLLYLSSCKKPTIKTDASFEKTYGGSLFDIATKAVYEDGYIYMVGTSSSYSANGDKDLLWMKIDEEGTLIEKKTFGGTGVEEGFNIIATQDGNLLLSGLTNSFGNGYDIYLIKINKTGAVLWEKQYGSPAFDLYRGLLENSKSEILLLGSRSNGTTKDFCLYKLDASGNELWKKQYTSPHQDEGVDIVEVGEEDYFLLGRRNAGDYRFHLTKIDKDGDLIWSKDYGTPDYEFANAIGKASDGNYIMTGHSAGVDPQHNLYSLKIDTAGTLLWQSHYGGAAHDGAGEFLASSSGELFFVGETDSYGNGSKRTYFVKTDLDGNQIQEGSYGGDFSDKANDIVESPTAYYIVGETNSFSADQQSDVYVIKLLK